MEEVTPDYRVVKSQSRVYRSTLSLKSLYGFNAFLVALGLLVTLPPLILLLTNIPKETSGSVVQFVSHLGITFFAVLTGYVFIALLLNIGTIYLLGIGVRRDWPVLTGVICFITAMNHALSLLSLFIVLFATLDVKNDSLFSSPYIAQASSLATTNMTAYIAVIFIQLLIASYSLAFLIHGINGFREALRTEPLSTIFDSGVLVNSARKEDTETLRKIHYSLASKSDPEKNSYQLWKKRMRRVNFMQDIRVARVDDRIVGFLITSKGFKKVESVYLAGVASNRVESDLLRDFARLHVGSNEYVDFIEVSLDEKKVQKALMQNGWTQVGAKPNSVYLQYGVETA